MADTALVARYASLMDRNIHMAICSHCEGKVVHVHIGPSLSQHVCERCGSTLDPKFTETVLLRDPRSERNNAIKDPLPMDPSMFSNPARRNGR